MHCIQGTTILCELSLVSIGVRNGGIVVPKLTNQQLVSLNPEVSTSLFMLIDKLLTNIARVGTGWAGSSEPADKPVSSAFTKPKVTEGGSFHPLPLQLLMKCLPEI